LTNKVHCNTIEELVQLIEEMDFDVALAELKKRITNETNNLKDNKEK